MAAVIDRFELYRVIGISSDLKYSVHIFLCVKLYVSD